MEKKKKQAPNACGLVTDSWMPGLAMKLTCVLLVRSVTLAYAAGLFAVISYSQPPHEDVSLSFRK